MSAVSATGLAGTPPWGASLLSALNAANKYAANDPVRGGTVAPSDTVTLSNTAKKLGAQDNRLGASTLMQRAAQLGQATMDAAVQFVGDFAKSLFGDAANSMQLQMDSAQWSASSSFASMAQVRTNGLNQTASQAATLQDTSEFVGSGTLVTADGQRFNFQVDVEFQSTQSMAMTTQSHSARSTQPAVAAKNPGPVVQFPGTLDNFLALLHQGGFSQPVQWNATGPAAGTDPSPPSGMLRFRLLNQLPATH